MHLIPPFPGDLQTRRPHHQSPLPVPVVSEVIPVPGAAGGARQGARGSAGDAGEALRVPGVRKEVPEVGRPVGAQEDPRGEKVRTSRLMRPGKSNVTYGIEVQYYLPSTFYVLFLTFKYC